MRKFLLLILVTPFFASAQTDSSGSADILTAVLKQERDQILYNGKQNVGYAPNIAGIPYYQTKEWQPGSIIYHDVYFPDVFLKYDLVSKELIIMQGANSVGITLFTPRLKRFSIAGKKFLRSTGEDESHLPIGIYDQMVTGKISFYVHRSKFIKETIVDLELHREFVSNDTYFIIKDGVHHQVKNQKDILDILRDKRREIKKDLKRKGLRFKSDPDEALTEMVTYYNQTAT